MAIEITDEMREAFVRAMQADDGTAEGGERALRSGLAAALAVVERDWNMQPNPNARCAAATGAFRCGRAKGHGGMHHIADGWVEMSWP